MIKTGKCALRRAHTPIPIETEWHHILPKAMGGLDVWPNKIELCALCHDNVHALMFKLAHRLPVPPGYRAEKSLAKRALYEWNMVGNVPRGAHG